MPKKRLAAVFTALILIGAGVVSTHVTGTIANKGDVVIALCNQGHSDAVVEIPATTDPTTMPTTTALPSGTPRPTTAPTTYPFGGTITIQTATNQQAGYGSSPSPGPWSSPYKSYVLGALGAPVATPDVVSSYPAKMYIALGGDEYVRAVFTSPSPGVSAEPNNVTISCTGASS